MRVATVITRSDVLGGASHHVADVSSHLLERGHEVMVFVGGTGPYLDLLTRRGVPHRAIPALTRRPAPTADLRAFRSLRRELRAWNPDIVATHTSKAGAIGRLAAWSLGLPATYTPHGWSFGPAFPGASGTVYTAVERLLARVPGTVILNVSGQERTLALSRSVGRASRHVVVHNGVRDIDPGLFGDPTSEVPTIVVVARHESPKDHSTLLHALAAVSDLSWRCVIVGGGEEIDTTRALGRQLGLTARVDVRGHVDDVPTVIAGGSLLVLSSRSEGFPLCVLEAMRAGLPVVASDVGGISEAVDDGRTGILVPPGEVAALARAMRELLTNADLRASLGGRGRQTFADRFTIDGMVDRLEAIYRVAATGARGFHVPPHAHPGGEPSTSGAAAMVGTTAP
jgi:glycosyltransferase involved in cell wall biosynthesis